MKIEVTAKHNQSGITWEGKGKLQIQHSNTSNRNGEFYLILVQPDGTGSSKKISKGVAQMLLNGGMNLEG